MNEKRNDRLLYSACSCSDKGKSVDDIVHGMVVTELPLLHEEHIGEVHNVVQMYIPVLGVEQTCEYVCSIMKSGGMLAKKRKYDQGETVHALVNSMREIYKHDVLPARNPERRAKKALAILQDTLNELIHPSYTREFPEPKKSD